MIHTLRDTPYPQQMPLGTHVFELEKLKNLDIGRGVIDKYGTMHQLNLESGATAHHWLALGLHNKGKVNNDFIRVEYGNIHPGLFEAETLTNTIDEFCLNEPMAIALYNGVASRNKFRTFEEKLAYYGSNFGFYSTGFKHCADDRIYNRKLFNLNMEVLQTTVGVNNFSKSNFIEVLNSDH